MTEIVLTGGSFASTDRGQTYKTDAWANPDHAEFDDGDISTISWTGGIDAQYLEVSSFSWTPPVNYQIDKLGISVAGHTSNAGSWAVYIDNNWGNDWLTKNPPNGITWLQEATEVSPLSLSDVTSSEVYISVASFTPGTAEVNFIGLAIEYSIVEDTPPSGARADKQQIWIM